MKKKNKKAFTLFEMVMVISVSALVLWVMVYAFIVGGGLFSSEKNTADALVEATRAIELMTSEIRNGRQVQTATAAQFTFWFQDLNENASMEADEQITYSWDGTVNGNLIRTVSGASKAIARYVKDFQLSYDSESLLTIKKVTIKLTTGLEDDIITMESTALLRNM